jgi:hypothetical protein
MQWRCILLIGGREAAFTSLSWIFCGFDRFPVSFSRLPVDFRPHTLCRLV